MKIILNESNVDKFVNNENLKQDIIIYGKENKINNISRLR